MTALLNFLQALAHTPYWRTLPERPGRHSKPKAYQGIDSNTIEALRAANEKGDAIFMIVNEGDGYTDSKIKEITALFLDLDAKTFPDQATCDQTMRLAHEGRTTTDTAIPQGWPHASIVVRSGGGGYHLYWLLAPGTPLHLFKPVQQALAGRYGGDPAICNLARIMRAPGFTHWKSGLPVDVELCICKPERRYTLENLLKLLEIEIEVTGKETTHIDNSFMSEGRPDTRSARETLTSALSALNPDCPRPQWLKICCAVVAHGWPDSHDLAIQWSRSGSKFNIKAETDIRSLKPDGLISAASLYWEARQAGWSDPGNECPSPASQTGTMCRFVNWLGNRYAVLNGHWCKWDGAYWKPVAVGVLQRELLTFAQEWMVSASAARADSATAKAELKGALALLAQRGQDAVLELARRQLGFDTEPAEGIWELTTPAGTVDLRFGTVKPPDPLRYATLCTGVAPARSSDIEPVEFLRFLRWAFQGNEDIVRYMQLWLGRALSGCPALEQLHFWHGRSGANGKSTLANVLAYVLGTYCRAIDPALLMGRTSDGVRPQPDLIALKGVRVALCNEVRAGATFDDAQLKALSSTEIIAARGLYSSVIEQIKPTWSILLRGNVQPKVRDHSGGVWRRLKVIPFKASMPEQLRDTGLENRLKAEGAAILRWLIDGCVDAVRDGINTPALVVEAVAMYREDESQVDAFIETAVEAGGWTSRKDLLSGYLLWSGANSNDIESKTLLAALRDRHLKESKREGTRGFQCTIKPGAIEQTWPE